MPSEVSRLLLPSSRHLRRLFSCENGSQNPLHGVAEPLFQVASTWRVVISGVNKNFALRLTVAKNKKYGKSGAVDLKF